MGKEHAMRRAPAVCPRCGATYTDYPALSRKDNETLLCPDCGVREALESIGVSIIEQNEILKIIHRHPEASADGN